MPIDEAHPFDISVLGKEVKEKQVPPLGPGMPQPMPGGTTWQVRPGEDPVPMPVKEEKK